MGYDFATLQTIYCLDAVTLRVPARWRCGPDDNGFWSCYEEGEETGTLWIKILHFRTPAGTTSDPAFDARRALDDLVENWNPKDGANLSSEVIGFDDRYLWKRIFDDADCDGPSRHFCYMFYLVGEDRTAFVVFDFVLPLSVVEEPEIQDLVAIVDREIRAARLDPFGYEAPFLPLHKVGFGDKLAVDLPRTLRTLANGGPDGNLQDQWYCYFRPDDIEARMVVEIVEHILADEDTWQPTSVDPQRYADIIEHIYPARKRARGDVSQLPDGMLVHYGYDSMHPPHRELADGPPRWFLEPLRYHEWQYFRFSHGVLRVTTFFLMMPLRSAEAPPLVSLVGLLDREIRRADFPDLDLDENRRGMK